MANETDVTGTMYFKGNWDKSIIKRFVEVFNRHFFTGYGTYFTEIVDVDYDDNLASFNATGRTSYEVNLRNLNNWALNNDCPVDMNKEQFNDEWKPLLSEMYQNNLKIEIEYTDEAQINNRLVAASGQISVRNKNNQLSLSYKNLRHWQYPYNRTNLQYLGLCSDDDYPISKNDVKKKLKESYGLIFREENDGKHKMLNAVQENQLNYYFEFMPFAKSVEEILCNLSWIPST